MFSNNDKIVYIGVTKHNWIKRTLQRILNYHDLTYTEDDHRCDKKH